MKEQEFDHIIKEKLNAIQDEPPAYMWDRVSAGIAAQQSGAGTGMSLTAKILLVASVAIVIISGLFLLNKSIPKEQRKAHSVNPRPQSTVHIKHLQTKREEETAKPQNIRQNTAQTPEPARKHTASNAAQKPVSGTPKQASPQNSSVAASPVLAKNENNTTENNIDESTSAPNIQTAANKEAAQKHEEETAPIVAASASGSEVVREATDISENTETQQDLAQEQQEGEMPQESVQKPEEKAPEQETATPVETTEEIPAAEKEAATEKQEEAQAENVTKENPEANNELVQAEAEAKAETVPESAEPENAPVINDPKSRIRNQYGIGLHYGPEFLNEDNLSFTDHALDLSFNYRNYDFIFQTGLGVRFSKDNVNYDMRYRKWEYLETQIRFDSAKFVLDNNGNPVLVPIDPYYEEVYDSVQHTYTATAKEHYTMLQIPLLAGYIFNKGDLSLFAKGGIRYSVVIYQNTTGLFDPGNEANIEQLNYPKKTRVQSNIDYELSLGAGYRIFPKMQLQIEGIGRFYQHSLFDDNPNKNTHPTSLSIRAGLVYIF
jgi:hypothetical protein